MTLSESLIQKETVVIVENRDDSPEGAIRLFDFQIRQRLLLHTLLRLDDRFALISLMGCIFEL